MNIGKQVRLAELDIVPHDSVVFAGPAEKVMTFVPFSRYHNDSFGIDKSDEQKAYLLGETGRELAEVRGGYSSRYSDGSSDSREGEQVGTALKSLSESERGRVRFVLVVNKQEAEDNTRRGLKIRDDVTAKLYAIQ